MKRPPAAVIDEPRCIGCTRCIDACPVDAIVGAHNLMHTVVEPWCIGCELCLPPCPVDCIAMVPRKNPFTEKDKRSAGERGRARKLRLEKSKAISVVADRRAILEEILSRKRT